jgi:hypothetical protein
MPAGQGSLEDAASGSGAALAWSFSDAGADLSLMKRAMDNVLQLGVGGVPVCPKPLDPHLQAVRTGDAALIVTKSGRRVACRRDSARRETELQGAEAETVVASLSEHLLEMPESGPARADTDGNENPPDPGLLSRLRDLGYAD